MTIIASLLRAADLPDSPTARLDAELLLAAALGKSRSFLHTWPERIVPSEAALTFAEYLQRRRGGEPVAYILGQQGFWKLDLEVAPHTRVLVDHPRLAKTESTSRRRVSESKRRRRGEGGSVNIGKSRRRVSDVPITLVAVDTHVPREGRIVIGEAVTHQGRVARSGDGSERNVRLEASDA